jgi:integrase
MLPGPMNRCCFCNFLVPVDGQFPNTGNQDVVLRVVLHYFERSKRELLDSGELSARTFRDYQRTASRLAEHFGGARAVSSLQPADFGSLRSALATTLGPMALGTEIQRIRSVFKLAFDDGIIARPVIFGSMFRKPSRKVLRAARIAAGCRLFDAPSLRSIIAACRAPLKAMVLLGINCGFGNNDCAKLPIAVVDLDAGWVDFPRPKTAVPRHCPLWPETVIAVADAIARRAMPQDDDAAELCFLTTHGTPWRTDLSSNSPISKEFGKLLVRLGLKRPRLNFYALRHTFETIGGDTGDQVAVNAIMGHVDESMPAVYRERIHDARLRTVADNVRCWLFGCPLRDARYSPSPAMSHTASL